MKTLLQLSDSLRSGTITSRELVEQCLARAKDPDGEGQRVFISIESDAALAQADAMDLLRQQGAEPSQWAGIPISVKDLFDIRGQTTRAGSVLRQSAEPAAVDCPAIARLRRAGFVFIGRTNMTEFAYSGLGLNPHYGTPRNPFDRAVGRIPGGSSAGAAISVTDSMAAAGIGTDTGGSCRIPAALTGITGFKPTARRVPLDGVFPLSMSLDSVGPLAREVSCCAVLDDVLAGGSGRLPEPAAKNRIKLAVLTNYVVEDLDAQVAATYQRALDRLGAAGFELVEVAIAELERLPGLNAQGGLAAAEAYALHRSNLDSHLGDYDPRVGDRILAGAQLSAADYIDLLAERAAMIETFSAAMNGFDAIVAPTVPVIAPPIGALADDDDYRRINLLMLRNPSVFNFLDGCAISIPIQQPADAPVGMMLAATGGGDRHLLNVSLSVEQALR